MRLIGIDFGKKRIGIAVSDEAESLAFPHDVLLNDKDAIEKIHGICEANTCGKIILGESKDFNGNDNQVMNDIKLFEERLKLRGLEVVYEPEIMSTIQAERVQGKHTDIDASAAAIILQSYLDRMQPKKESTDESNEDQSTSRVNHAADLEDDLLANY